MSEASKYAIYLCNLLFNTTYSVIVWNLSHKGIQSSTASITRYRVEGKIEKPVTEAVAKGLKKNTISDIDNDITAKSVGWTSFESPFSPKFEGSSFLYGNFYVFSLRIDRKSIPAKLIKKFLTLETSKRLEKTQAPVLVQG